MKRRKFIKRGLIAIIGFFIMSNKLIANQIFKSSLFKDGIFHNNFISHNVSSFKKFLQWRKESKKPDPITFPLAKNNPVFLKNNRITPTITWVGHATFLIQIAGLNILTDPHFTERASPFNFAGPSRTTPVGLKIEDLPKIDLIIISHNHYDHLDKQTIQQLIKKQQDNQPLILVPLKLKKLLEKFGAKNVQELGWWDNTILKNIKIHSVPVQHWSKRSFTDTNKSLWCGWVIDAPNYRTFFCGDTGYSKDFGLIQKKFKYMDLSLIPIGAYAPRWFMKYHHCNVEEAIQIHKDIKSKRSIGMHWGTFILTDEPMREPIEKLEQLTKQKNISPEEFTVIQHGRTVKI